MKKYLQNILFTFLIFNSAFLIAQKLYWVGSSGNFNDAAHWSYTSGGVGGAKTPTNIDDVYFDENSFSEPSVINFTGNIETHDFIFSQYTPKVIFQGLQHEKITISGNLSLNAYIDNRFAGDIWLTSTQASTSVSFALTKLKGNIYFNGNTTWLLPTNLLADDEATIYFKQGTFNLFNTSINSGNLIASSGVTINSNQCSFRITNKFILPSGVILNDNKSTIRAYTKDLTKFQVAPTITFNTNSRLHNLNNVMTACAITGSSTQPTCSGNCDGTITFNIPPAECSGTDTIFLHWSPLDCGGLRDTFFTPSNTPTTFSVVGLCACLNQYVSTFANNIAEDTVYASPPGVPMANPPPPVIQNPFTTFPPSCFGKCDGKIVMNIAIGSGVAPLTSTWTPTTGATTVHTGLNNIATNHHDTLKNACAGIYSVTLADAHGCASLTSTVNLAQPLPVTSTLTVTMPICNGTCSGVITSANSGGTPSYTCTMDSAGGSNVAMPGCTASGLCAGSYTIFAKDTHGCKDTNVVIIVPPPAITFIKTPASGTLNIPCISACSGSVSVTNVAGGVPFTVGNAYTYSWSPPGVGTITTTSNSSTYSGLCGSVAGITYTCTITDSSGCTKTTTFTVKAPPALTLTTTFTIAPKCNLSTDGSVTVTASGGKPVYTFTWAPQGGATGGVSPVSTYSNIGGGTYTVVITDANGCLDSTRVTLTPPPALTGIMTTTVNPTCPNLNNGHLCVTAGGGTPGPGYTYTWSPNPPAAGTASCTPSTLTVTPGGISVYSVTITDAKSCTLTVTGTLISPPLVAVTATVTSPPCSGVSNGSATLTPISGVPNYTYAYSCSISTDSTISGQPGGTTCNYTVTDGNSCRTTGTVTFTLPSPLTLSLSVTTTLTCVGGCNAQITSSAGGGNPFLGPTYTYSWTGAGVTPNAQNQTGLCAGNYTCTITDANGCPKTATVTVQPPSALTLTPTHTIPKCNLSTDGSATVTATGGTLTYTAFAWNPSGTISGVSPKSINSNIGGGTYTVVVTDSNGCLDSTTVTLTPPPALTGIITTTVNPTCPTYTNGQLCVTAGGGTPGLGYTYTWSPNPPAAGTASCTPSTLTVTPGGTSVYNVTITDANSCTLTVTGTLTSPPLVAVTASVISPPCSGIPNGSATLTATGGSGYSYQWSCTVGTTSVITGQSGGTSCNYTVTDGIFCRTTGTVTFTLPSPLVAAVKNIKKTCSGCNGGATDSVSGGRPPYAYSWDHPVGPFLQSDSIIDTLCVGTHTLYVKDANGCLASVTFSVPPAETIIISVPPATVSCHDSCNATATATASGGTSPYNIQWVGTTTCTAVTSSCTASGLCSGTHTISVTDFSGCSSTSTFTIVNPPALSASVTTVSVQCFGQCTGAATLTPSGGTPNPITPFYTINWNPPTGFSYTTGISLCPGTYTASILDHNGCPLTQTVAIGVSGQFTVTPTITTPTTCGASDGSISLAISGGSGTYTVSWNSPYTGNPLNGIPAGSYTATIKDANNCDTTIVYGISSSTGPAMSYTINNEASCYNVCDGSATVVATGTNNPITVTWQSPPFPTGTGTITATGLCGNPSTNYTVQATDAMNCVTFTTVTITSPTKIQAVATSTNPTCGGSNGVIRLVVSGGSGAGYSFVWNGGTLPPNNPETGLPAGVYTVVIKDGAGCTQPYTFTLTSVSSPSVSSINTTSVTCSYLTNGSATATVNGGTTAYSYTWTNSSGVIVASGINIANVSNLPCGNYTVNVKDNIGCPAQATFSIICATPINANLVKHDNLCNAPPCTGSATVSPTGGNSSSYSYLWNVPLSPTTNTVSAVCAGNYSVTITDANTCTVTVPFTITAPIPISITTVTPTPPSCFDGTNGSATVTVTGGTPHTIGSAYTYSWSPGASTFSVATNLSLGCYTVTVTDSNSCAKDTIVCITQPSKINPHITKNNPTCLGNCNGKISSTPTGGTAPYTFTWTPLGGVISCTACASSIDSNLCAPRSDTLIVMDGNGCRDTTAITLSLPAKAQATYTTSSATCGTIPCNGSITITGTSGGTGSITVNWINTSCGSSVTCNTLCAGTYSVQLIDSVNCIDTVSISISNTFGPSVTTSFTNVTCFGGSNGEALVTNVNNSHYTYSWSPTAPGTIINTSTSSLDSGLTIGTYISTITDSAGCITIKTFTIGQPSQISAILTASPASCFGINDGSIISTGSGGTPFAAGYLYSIDNGTYLGISSSETFTALPASSHTVCIKDTLNCINCFPYNVPSNSIITSTISATKITCFDSCNGTATVFHIQGGTPTYTVTWNDPRGQVDSFATALCAGSYTATITDALGCQGKDTIKIIAPLPISLHPDTTNPTCGQCNGTITLSPTGGTGTTYTYTWSPSSVTGTGGAMLCAGTYSVVVTDSNGCKINWFDTLRNITLALPVAQAGPNQFVFIGQTATIGGNPTNPIGGTIVWEPNTALSDSTVGNPIVSPTVTTTFTVIVTNTLGCKATDTMVVTVFPPFTITTGFTPNNDGKNDTWVIDQLDRFPSAEVEIYNRWGEQLFYAPKGTYKPWDGTYQGQLVPVGTYYYIIRLNDKDYPDHYAGPLTILR